MKIAIIGYSGSGKSTLAKKLGEIYGITPLYLDTINFKPNWESVDEAESDKIACEYLKNESWIIEGNWNKTAQNRYDEADLIIFLDFNRFVCLKNAVLRYFKYRNKVRFSAAEGCKEKFDYHFFIWILRDGRTKKIKEAYKDRVIKYHDKIIVFKSRRKVNKYVRGIEKNCLHANS